MTSLCPVLKITGTSAKLILTLMNSLSNLGYVFIVYDNFGNYMKCIDINTNVNNFFSDLNIYILQSRKF